MKNRILPYNPGVLPTKCAPNRAGEIVLKLSGMPPYKDVHQSIRNIGHPRYDSFIELRNMAIEAMAGRAWYFGGVSLDLHIYAPKLHKNRNTIDYVGGIMDTLDGSSGVSFTYLPIVYEDDCQVAGIASRYTISQRTWYQLKIRFL